MKTQNNHTEKIFQRLEEYIAHRGDNLAQLTLAIGVSNGYFYRMRKVSGSLGAEVLARICLYYKDLSADWLLTGRGAMVKGAATAKEAQELTKTTRELKELLKTIDVIEQNFSVLKEQAKVLK